MVLCKKRVYVRMVMDKKIMHQVILFMWRMNLNIWTWLAMSVSRRRTLTTMARMLLINLMLWAMLMLNMKNVMEMSKVRMELRMA